MSDNPDAAQSAYSFTQLLSAESSQVATKSRAATHQFGHPEVVVNVPDTLNDDIEYIERRLELLRVQMKEAHSEIVVSGFQSRIDRLELELEQMYRKEKALAICALTDVEMKQKVLAGLGSDYPFF
jgi:hypothetical protein